jgi:class 3 adenylate cyclase
MAVDVKPSPERDLLNTVREILRRELVEPRTAEHWRWAFSCHLLPFFAGYTRSAIRPELVDRYRGREIGTIGDGFVAIFDSPARGVRCALALATRAQDRRYAVRAGLHTGEVEQASDDVRGVAVHVAARVAAEAADGEVLVSSTTRALLAGAGFRLTNRGSRTLKGLDEPEVLYAVEPESA